MKPRIFRLGIFLLLWCTYLGADFISFASKKIAVKSYSNLVLSASKQEEFKAANENYIKMIKEASERQGPTADLIKDAERIKNRRAIFFYATLSVWFYLCTWVFYFFFTRTRAGA